VCSTRRRPPRFRHQPCRHAVDLDPGGAGFLAESRCCLRCFIRARPPRKRLYFGARHLHACRITACILPVYASWPASRQGFTQDSVPRGCALVAAIGRSHGNPVSADGTFTRWLMPALPGARAASVQEPHFQFKRDFPWGRASANKRRTTVAADDAVHAAQATLAGLRAHRPRQALARAAE